jgi:UDP-3-O-[3-hydroxymyristoyl] glucosamine N-acyltransferase
VRVKELAAWLNADWEGNGEQEVKRVAALEDAGSEDLAFVTRGRALKNAGASQASCLVVPRDFGNDPLRTVIRADDPRAAVARIIPKLYRRVDLQPGIHPTAIAGPGAIISPALSSAPWSRLAPGCVSETALPSARDPVIGDYVHIGDDCVIHPRVTIYQGTRLGNQVTLHSGLRDRRGRFRLVLADGIYEKFPQIGRVEIGDRVEIGANLPASTARRWA